MLFCFVAPATSYLSSRNLVDCLFSCVLTFCTACKFREVLVQVCVENTATTFLSQTCSVRNSVSQHTVQHDKGTGSHSHVCPSPSVNAPVDHTPLLAVITGGIGHFHTARASSGLTPLTCTRSKIPNQHGTNTCFTRRRAQIRARFPTLFLSGCGHAAAFNQATRRRNSSPALAAPPAR